MDSLQLPIVVELFAIFLLLYSDAGMLFAEWGPTIALGLAVAGLIVGVYYELAGDKRTPTSASGVSD